jgi:hypothetical protein
MTIFAFYLALYFSREKCTDIPKYYRMLQALNVQFNCCFKTLIMPFIFITLLLVNVISNYATVRLFHEVKMPAFLGFPMTCFGTTIIIADTFPTSYRMYEASEQLVAITKKSTVKNGYVIKVMKSCRPLAVDVGYFFYIKQETMITFLGIVIDNAIMMLLSF